MLLFLTLLPKFSVLYLIPLYPSDMIVYKVIYIRIIMDVFKYYALTCRRLLMSQSF